MTPLVASIILSGWVIEIFATSTLPPLAFVKVLGVPHAIGPSRVVLEFFNHFAIPTIGDEVVKCHINKKSQR